MFKKLKPTHKKVLLNFSGWTLVVLGGAGLFLPLLQGLLFIALGFYLLSLHSMGFHNLLMRLKAKYPALATPLTKVDNWVREQFGLEMETKNI